MVAAIPGAASAADPQSPKTVSVARPPLRPFEKDDDNAALKNPRKPKPKIVSSRYMSPSTSTANSSWVPSSRRFPSPLLTKISSNSPALSSKRSISADRSRPASVRHLTTDFNSRNGSATDMSAATKLLLTSTRSLSVSFQGESFSLPVTKTKSTHTTHNSTSMRKGTPESRRNVTPLPGGKGEGSVDQPESLKYADHHRWPARNRAAHHLSRNLVGSKLNGPVNGTDSLQQSMIDRRRVSLGSRLSLDSGNSELLKLGEHSRNGNSVNNETLVLSDITTSDSDSVSSGSTSDVRGCNGTQGLNGPRGIAASARFWQETNSRLRRLQDPGLPLSCTSPGSKLIMRSKSERFTSNGPLLSPIRGTIRPQSPSKIMTPQSRALSPSQKSNVFSSISSSFGATPSVLSYAVDVRRGKVGENGILDAHFLRLLYNQHLQWRFINARAERVLLVQQRSVKKHLWNAWITISDLRDTVTKKRHKLQLLRQKLKLATILKGQMTLLEDWASLDKEHSASLLGAIEALTTSTVRLPIFGAIANVESLQDAIGSAFHVMQTTTSNVCSVLAMVEKLNSLASELANLTTKERALLERCMLVVSSLAALQVKDISLRTHMIQHARL